MVCGCGVNSFEYFSYIFHTYESTDTKLTNKFECNLSKIKIIIIPRLGRYLCQQCDWWPKLFVQFYCVRHPFAFHIFFALQKEIQAKYHYKILFKYTLNQTVRKRACPSLANNIRKKRAKIEPTQKAKLKFFARTFEPIFFSFVRHFDRIFVHASPFPWNVWVFFCMYLYVKCMRFHFMELPLYFFRSLNFVVITKRIIPRASFTRDWQNGFFFRSSLVDMFFFCSFPGANSLVH